MFKLTNGIPEPLPFNPFLKNGRIHLTAPADFCIYQQDRADVLKYLSIIGTFTIEEEKPLHLDFSEIETMGAAVSVMLFAEITRAQLSTGISNIITYTLPRNIDIRKQFTKTGLLRAIKQGGQKKIDELFKENDVFQSGTDPDMFTLPIIEKLEWCGVTLSRQHKKLFSRGTQEAMLNVIHHAYDNTEVPLSGIGRRWWHAIFINNKTKKLVLIIYDKGQGIPRSMSGTNFPFFHQGQIIKHVIPKGVTRFKENPERGKGTQDIVQVMEIEDKSVLLIYSDRGLYIRNSDGEEVACEESKHSINGTLVEWQIPYEK